MKQENLRSVELERSGVGRFVVRNARGGKMPLGTGEDDAFTPVELLLAAIGGCTGIDVDLVTSRRSEPARFVIRVTGEKIKDESGVNRMQDLEVEFDVAFPEGPQGDKAREALPRIMQQSHDRLCTVTRTVEHGTPVAMRRTE
ncbi:OsmC family protein [Actinoplanes sp. M2I2]|uniref:OsmC family protein n=1 Tax=Actinoplanes sp. M2I2 TaxID=1734444 RepID=UPI0020225E05|nr:OsmC family protein [Actinoplanes sp. M2I2]